MSCRLGSALEGWQDEGDLVGKRKPRSNGERVVRAVAVLYVAGASVRESVVSELATMAVELGMTICG